MNRKPIFVGMFSALFVMSLVVLGGYLVYYEDNKNDVVPVSNEPKQDLEIDNENETQKEITVQEVEKVAKKEFALPLQDAIVLRNAYSLDASEEQQKEAIVEYMGSYHPIFATSYTSTSCKVIAVMDGKIEDVQEDGVLGGKIIQKNNDYTVIYYSLKNMTSEKYVKQGDVIGECSTSPFDGLNEPHVSIGVMVKNAYVDFPKLLENN